MKDEYEEVEREGNELENREKDEIPEIVVIESDTFNNTETEIGKLNKEIENEESIS